jgi:hypothetical protein
VADAILHNVRVTSHDGEPGSGEVATELVFSHAHLTLEVIAGEPDADGARSIDGFYLVATEATAEGEEAPDAVRVRIPSETETLRLLCSSVLDYLDKHREGRPDLTLASAEEIVQLNRHQRRHPRKG